MSQRYCPAFGPGSEVCPPAMCDCFIAQYPDDAEQAAALHPEFYQVGTPSPESGQDGGTP